MWVLNVSDFCHQWGGLFFLCRFSIVFKQKSGRDDHDDESGSSNDGGIENDALLLSMSIRPLEFEGFHFARVGGGDVWYESNTTNDENERN